MKVNALGLTLLQVWELGQMNDKAGMSFEQIADWIETNI
jgi:hypothetical protein